MRPKVSVLVPIYNVSNYIERCAHSLFQQTFEDIEYVFVNDATPDDSVEKLKKILEQYPNRQNQVKLLHHKENKGLASTRITALEASSGNYISIVDSDDYIELNMIELLYEKIVEDEADIAVCDIIVEYNNRSEYISDIIPDNKEDYLTAIVRNSDTGVSLWNKLYRRELYEREDSRVPSGLNYMEDRHVTTRLYYYANKITKVNQNLYHYVKYNPNAITKSKGKMHFENLFQFWNLLDQFFIEKNIQGCDSLTDHSKIQGKVNLLIQSQSCKLFKEYGWLFRDIEMKYIRDFRRGERIMLFLVHYKLFTSAHLFAKLLRFKNRNHNQ